MSLIASPKLLKGSLVVLDAESSRVQRIISLQYNSDSLSRSLQVQRVGADSGDDRSEVLRLKGPAIETIKLEAGLEVTIVADKAGDLKPVFTKLYDHPAGTRYRFKGFKSSREGTC